MRNRRGQLDIKNIGKEEEEKEEEEEEDSLD